jgi:hypothetical protein
MIRGHSILYGLSQLPLSPVYHGDVGPCATLARAVADRLTEGQGLAEGLQRLLRLPRVGVDCADIVEGGGLATTVAGRCVQLQGLEGEPQGLLHVAQHLRGPGQIYERGRGWAQCQGLGAEVPDLAKAREPSPGVGKPVGHVLGDVSHAAPQGQAVDLQQLLLSGQ